MEYIIDTPNGYVTNIRPDRYTVCVSSRQATRFKTKEAAERYNNETVYQGKILEFIEKHSSELATHEADIYNE